MNTETAREIADVWLTDGRSRRDALVAKLEGLVPEPDAWALTEQRVGRELLSLAGRSLFRVSYALERDRLTVRRARITKDGDTQITVTEGPIGPRRQWERQWTFEFLKSSSEFGPLAFATTTTLDLDPPRLEALAREIARLAGWPVTDQQPQASAVL